MKEYHQIYLPNYVEIKKELTLRMKDARKFHLVRKETTNHLNTFITYHKIRLEEHLNDCK